MDTIIIDYQQESYKNRLRKRCTQIPAKPYLLSFFPIIQWIRNYNLSWLLQDIIAGVTVGVIAIPQGLSYSKIATLDPQYGLYSSFIGPILYVIFGTSKDISIGLISVVCLLTGKAIHDVTSTYSDITGPQVATTIALFAGIVTLAIGIMRLGIVVDFIPGPAIAAFSSGSAITIAMGQWPKLFGLKQINTHNPPYKIFIDFFKNIQYTQLDAAFGITGLVLLYMIKYGCNTLSKKESLPKYIKTCLFYLGIMRNGLLVIFATLISYLINREKATPVISIIKTVPAGLNDIGVPTIDSRIISTTSSILPSIIIIMLLEHLSAAKSFSQISGYSINSNQEIFAIGMSNVVGSFFSAAPQTGAFSRTAVMSRSGSKTPMAGLFTGLVVILSLYALTAAFYYIPDAILSAVVIHAVVDLISKPSYVYKLYKTSIIEFFIWFSALLIIIFVDVETGIYVSVALSLAIMLLRTSRPPVKPLARIALAPTYSNVKGGGGDDDFNDEKDLSILMKRGSIQENQQQYIYVDERDRNFQRYCLPLPPGIMVFRIYESLLYPNVEYISEQILATIKSRTRCGDISNMIQQLPWNQNVNDDDSSIKELQMQLPILKALVLDFASVRRLDSTALHALINLRTSINRYAGTSVDWYIVGIQNHHIRDELILYGFGYDDEKENNKKGGGRGVKKNRTDGNKNAQANNTTSTTTSSMTTNGNLSLNSNPQSFVVGNNHHNPYVPPNPPSITTTTNGRRNDHRVSRGSIISQLPQDRYPYFFWDIDSAVNTIVNRWKFEILTEVKVLE